MIVGFIIFFWQKQDLFSRLEVPGQDVFTPCAQDSLHIYSFTSVSVFDFC